MSKNPPKEVPEAVNPELGRWMKQLREAEAQVRKLLGGQADSVLGSEALRRSEALLSNAQRIAHFGSWEIDLMNPDDVDVNPLYWSDEVFRIFGHEPGEIEVTIENFFRSVHPEDVGRIKEAVDEAVRISARYSLDHRIILPNGTMRYVHEEAQVFKDPLSGRPLKIVGIVQDITERKENELRLKRLNRLYAVLSKINETSVCATNEKALCEKVCQIAVEDGALALAWVSEFDPGTQSVHPIAFYGVGGGDYVKTLQISAEAGLYGNGPGGLAFREGAPQVCQDIATDPRMEPWREAALQRGYHSTAAFPVSLGSNRQGVMAFYATEPNFFNKEELDLLISVSENVFFALDSIRKEQYRLEAETALRKSEEYYRLLFFDNPHPMWVYDLETMKFLAVNSSALRQYGYTENEFLLMTPQDLRVADEAPKFMDTTRLPSPAKNNIAERHHKKNGEIIDVEVYSDTITFNGRPARLAAVTDVTERKIFEERLSDQAALIDQARDAIVLRDMEGTILFWNNGAERLYGWKSFEAVGKSIVDLIYRDTEKHTTAMQVTLLKGEWSGELELVNRAGEPVMVEARWTLLRDTEDRPRSILTICTDITERKRVESHLLRVQRMESIGTLAGGIAHDLNNLLAPIIMGVDLLKHFGVDGPSLKVVNDIERSAKRGSSLVKQVLSFARGVEGTRIALPIQDVLGELEVIIGNTFPKDVTLETKIADDLPLIEGDPTQLNQVLLNLCVNARDAMPNGGRISIVINTVSVDAHYEVMKREIAAGRYVCIEVTDTGCGIPPQNMDKIFDPFFTTKELAKGTGLGLATTLGIIRNHGGFVNVYSEVDKGTTFKVYLPVQAEDSKAEKELLLTGKDSWPRGDGECILLVDDETSILTITQQTLEAFGYRVFTAENGAQAVSFFAVNREKIDLVITDMMMPVMDGNTTILALRQIDPKVKIVGASGLNSNNQVSRAVDAGVKHFLTKPYTTGTMLITLKAALTETA